MIEFKMVENQGVLKTQGSSEMILSELLSVNLSVIKSMTNTKSEFDDLKDSFVMLLVDEDVVNNYYENCYDNEIEKRENE